MILLLNEMLFYTCDDGLQAQYDWRFGYDAKRVKGLVDFQIYTDDLAKEMGVLPPLMKLFFLKPKLWMSIMFGPVSCPCVCSRLPWA